MTEKERELAELAAQISLLIKDKPCDVAVGALGLAMVGMMEMYPFDHNLVTTYLDKAAEDIKRRLN